MTEREQLTKEIQESEEQIKPKRDRLNELYREEADSVEKRIELAKRGKGDFKLGELRFAARSRCDCGAGFAYPEGCGIWGAWYCSDILLGRAEAGSSHSSPLPFSMYEVKSENQPSAQGATTRPEN